MNKSELIERIAVSSDIPMASARLALDSLIATITEELKQGESVALVGFGTFSVSHRAARAGRNPRTGAVINITASKVPTFKCGKLLKDACN